MEKKKHDCRENCSDTTPCDQRGSCEDRCEFCGTCHDHHCHEGGRGRSEDQEEHTHTKPVEVIHKYEWIIDSAGTQLFASDDVYDMLGWIPSEIEGSNAFDRVPKEQREKAILEFRRSVDDGRPMRATVQRGDGTFEEIVCHTRPIIHKETGAVLAYRGVCVLARHFHPKKPHLLTLTK